MKEREPIAYIRTYTADDEEPDCMRCIYVCDGDENACCNHCGPHHGWSLYKRLEAVRYKKTEGGE